MLGGWGGSALDDKIGVSEDIGNAVEKGINGH